MSRDNVTSITGPLSEKTISSIPWKLNCIFSISKKKKKIHSFYLATSLGTCTTIINGYQGYQVLTPIKLRQVCALFGDVSKLCRCVSEIVYHLADRFDQAHGNTPSTKLYKMVHRKQFFSLWYFKWRLYRWSCNNIAEVALAQNWGFSLDSFWGLLICFDMLIVPLYRRCR